MKVNVSRVSYEEIELSDANVIDITRRKLLEMVYPGEYLRTESGKVVVKQDDPSWRHGSVHEEYCRDATEFDIAVFTVLASLNDIKYRGGLRC